MKYYVLVGVLLCSLAGCEREPAAPAVDKAAAPAPEAPALPRRAAPAGARVFIVSPADGASVSSPVRVEFGAENVAIARAGSDEPGSGHHHLIVDAPLPALDRPIPASEHYLHFGDAATSTTLTLEPGRHELQLLLGDYLHVPHDPPVVSDVITITVTP